MPAAGHRTTSSPVVFDDLLHKVAMLIEHRQLAWSASSCISVERLWDFDNLVGQCRRFARS
jgi:hypothetical protein